MFEIKFEAKKVDITDEKEDKYYMVSLADDENDPKNYLIFQKTYDPEELEEDSELSGTYLECNGESCYDCCNLMVLNGNELSFEVKGTKFNIYLIDEVFNRTKFIDYMNKIFDNIFISK